jgi:hypothetical protein
MMERGVALIKYDEISLKCPYNFYIVACMQIYYTCGIILIEIPEFWVQDQRKKWTKCADDFTAVPRHIKNHRSLVFLFIHN